jgi:predicted dehydrogenase
VYSDTDVLTEVAAHDVAILTSLVSESPLRLHAWGVGRIDAATVDAAHIVLQWKSGCIAQIDVQWSSVVRRRDMEIEGTTGTLVLHSGSVPEELHLYDHGKAYEELRNGGRPGSTAELIKCLNIDVESGEPLCDELSHFLECIESGRKPRTDFEFSRKVVSILEAARQSMHSGGSGVDLP